MMGRSAIKKMNSERISYSDTLLSKNLQYSNLLPCKIEIKRNPSVDLFAALSVLDQFAGNIDVSKEHTNSNELVSTTQVCTDSSLSESTKDKKTARQILGPDGDTAQSQQKWKRLQADQLKVGNKDCKRSRSLGSTSDALANKMPKIEADASKTKTKLVLEIKKLPALNKKLVVKVQNKVAKKMIYFGNPNTKKFMHNKTKGASLKNKSSVKKAKLAIEINKNTNTISIGNNLQNEKGVEKIKVTGVVRPIKSQALKVANQRINVDLNTLRSPLCRAKSLQTILNEATFMMLPIPCRAKLIKLLPQVDQQSFHQMNLLTERDIQHNPTDPAKVASKNNHFNEYSKLSPLKNEFFSRACQDWLEHLKSGHFTSKGRQLIEKVKDSQLEIEPTWGQNKQKYDSGKSSNYSLSPKSKEICAKKIELIELKVNVQKSGFEEEIMEKELQDDTDESQQLIDENEPVYCLCRKPYSPQQRMIGCDFCDEWYHERCLKISEDEAKQLFDENWACPNCKIKTSQHDTHFTPEEEQKINDLPLM